MTDERTITRSVALFAGAPEVEFQVPVPESLDDFVEAGMVASKGHARKLALDQWIIKCQGRFRRSASDSLVSAVKTQTEGIEDPTLEDLDPETRERLERWAERNAREYEYGGTISREMSFSDLLEKAEDLSDEQAAELLAKAQETHPHLFE